MLGGTILDALSWQWLFAINIVPGSVALLLAWRALPRETAVDRSPFDAPGAVLSAALLGSAIMLADSLQLVTQNINQTATGWGLLAHGQHPRLYLADSARAKSHPAARHV